MPVIDSGIVSITITRETTALPRASFSIGLLLAATTPLLTFTERTRLYAAEDLSDIALMFGSASAEYIAAAAYFGQSPKPESLRIGKRDAAVAAVKKIVFSVDLVSLNVINGTVNGEALAATTFATDHLTTMGAIATKIAAIEGVASAVVGGSGNREITVTATAEWQLTLTGFVVTAGAGQAAVTYATTAAGSTVEDDLIDCETEIDDWYGVLLPSSNKGAILAAAGYVESRKKQFFHVTDESDCKDATTTDIMARLEAQSLTRTIGLWHQDTAENGDAGWMGRCFAVDPGNSRYAYRNIALLTVTGRADLDTNGKTNIESKKGNYYVETGGTSITMPGTAYSGDYGDTIRDIDYLESEIAADLFSLIANNEKIPMTSEGINMVRATLTGTLNRMVSEGVIDTGFTVTVPKLSEITENERASRILPRVKFNCRTTGGIQTIQVNGVTEV
jgi:hypothetical protein